MFGLLLRFVRLLHPQAVFRSRAIRCLSLGTEDLHDYGESEHDKVLDTYLPFLSRVWISQSIWRERDPGVYKGELLRRYSAYSTEGWSTGMFVARDGYEFCSVDYSALELCTLSQIALLVVGGSENG